MLGQVIALAKPYYSNGSQFVEITPSMIGAAASSHTHNYAGSASAGGTAYSANNVYYTHTNEINFKGGKQAACYFNYRNADSDATDGGTAAINYKFCNYTSSTAYTTIEAGTFKGNLSGNASSATKATQDGSGNTITSTYSKVGHTHDYAASDVIVVSSTAPSSDSCKLWIKI